MGEDAKKIADIIIRVATMLIRLLEEAKKK